MTTDLVGKRLGEFEVVRELGRGGMGVVFEAVQTSLNRCVALKVLGPGLGLTPRAVERFQREAEAAAKLHHTNIVPVYATGEEGGIHFYAMELIDGPSLDAVIRLLREGEVADTDSELPANLAATGAYVPSAPSPAPARASDTSGSSASRFDRAAAMIADVADALQHAHAHGVTHRDIKPSNLLLSADGRLSVTDFGLARMLEQPGMTVTGEFVGTPAYMSPEQITAGRIPVDHRTDIYSLGATLYELLTLRPPFTADGRDRLLAMVIQKEPVSPRKLNPRVPRDLETICLKCLEKDPDRRYQTAKELADDLRRHVNRFAILARRAGPLAKAKKWVKRNPWITAAGLAVVLAVGASGYFARDAHQARQQRLAEKRQELLRRALDAALTGDLKKALASLEEADGHNADRTWVLFIHALVKHQQGNPAGAIEDLTAALESKPDWVAAAALRAICYGEDHQGDNFAREIERVRAMSPATPEDHLFRGYMLVWHHPTDSEKDLDAAIDQKAHLGYLFRARARAARAFDRTDRAGMDKALEDLQMARTLFRDSTYVRVVGLEIQLTAWVLYDEAPADRAKADAAKALAALDAAALADVSGSQMADARKAFYSELTGDTEGARRVCAAAAARTDPPPWLVGHAFHLYRVKHVREALDVFERHPRPDDPVIAQWRLLCLAELDPPRALSETARLVGKRPWAQGLQFVFGYLLLGRPADATEAVKRVLRRDEGAGRPVDPPSRFLLGEWSEEDLLRDAAKSRLRTTQAHVIIGLRKLAAGDRDGARADFEKAAAKRLFTYSSHHFSGCLLARMKDETWPPWITNPKK